MRGRELEGGRESTDGVNIQVYQVTKSIPHAENPGCIFTQLEPQKIRISQPIRIIYNQIPQKWLHLHEKN